jgi:putative transposase
VTDFTTIFEFALTGTVAQRVLSSNLLIGAVFVDFSEIIPLRNVEDLLPERGIVICHETVRHWAEQFGPHLAYKIRKHRSERMRQSAQWQWHLDEVFVKICGQTYYLWRAVDHQGEVLECFVTKAR